MMRVEDCEVISPAVHLAPGPLTTVDIARVSPPHTSLALHPVPLPAPGVHHRLLPHHAALARPPPLPVQLTWQEGVTD